jgi:hypothetical protein
MAEDDDDPCAAEEHRQFDFWLGDWEVRDPDGKLVGHNRITRLWQGCALREEWEGASGHRGTSLNAWSAERGTWHQTWVDSSGLVLLLDGGLHAGVMVLEGMAPAMDDPARPMARHRVSWSRIDGDPARVRQHWEISTDDGSSWRTLFDGRYSRA